MVWGPFRLKPPRAGAHTPVGEIGWRVDQHRLGGGGAGGLGGNQDYLEIVPPYLRDWSSYQTFWDGNQYPGFTFESTKRNYNYPFAAVRHDVPGSATFMQLRGGAIDRQVGAVSMARLLDKIRAAWASTQGG